MKNSNATGYQKVLDFFVEENGGRKYGAKTLMANRLGISLASADGYEEKGFPLKHWPKLKEITGFAKTDIWPELLD